MFRLPFVGYCHALLSGDGQLYEEDPLFLCRPHDNIPPESSSCYYLSGEDQLLLEVHHHLSPFAGREHSVHLLGGSLERATRLDQAY